MCLHLARDTSLSLLIIYTYAHTSLNNRSFVACLCVLLLLYDYTWFLHALIVSFVIALYLHMRLLIACLLGIREQCVKKIINLINLIII